MTPDAMTQGDGSASSVNPHRERTFVPGGRYSDSFTFPAGRVGVRATVASRGSELLLWDVELFVVDSPRIAIGISGVRALLSELCRLAEED
jgi:hypothetical protein